VARAKARVNEADAPPAAASLERMFGLGLTQFGSIRIRPAFHEVVALLVDAIRSGYWRVGDRLPPVRELAAELNVSHPVVLEALEVLERAGVVEIRRGRWGGTVLVSLAGLPAVLADLLGDDIEPISMLLQARRVLELEACLLASARALPEEFAHLHELVAEAHAAIDDFDAFLELTVRFHIVIAVMSRNTVLAECLRMIANRMAVAGRRASVRPSKPFMQSVYEMMAALVAAIEEGDETAIRRHVDRHISLVADEFTEVLDGSR
jgi:GntR family transcriptional regulator, transcriptional repressor for pyruvate dehydrogenase complex